MVGKKNSGFGKYPNGQILGVMVVLPQRGMIHTSHSKATTSLPKQRRRRACKKCKCGPVGCPLEPLAVLTSCEIAVHMALRVGGVSAASSSVPRGAAAGSMCPTLSPVRPQSISWRRRSGCGNLGLHRQFRPNKGVRPPGRSGTGGRRVVRLSLT